MYPVSLGYDEAIKRIRNLQKNGHDAEAFVTTVFTVEKTLRRTLRQLVVSVGFNSKMADKIVKKLRGFDILAQQWELYDPQHRKLTDFASNDDWQQLKKSNEKRNEVVHGVRVYSLVECRQEAEATISALNRLKVRLDREYGYRGWQTAKSRMKSKLHLDPKVRIAR